MKTRVLFPVLLAMLASSGLARADGNGSRTGYSGDPGVSGGRSCDACHGGGAVPTVDMTGPMTVTPGSTNTYTLTISGGQRNAGGLDVSATMGALAAFEAGTRLNSGEIVHTAPKAADSGGVVAFSFDWTAPSSPGTAALYGAGLSTNGDGRDSGDEVERIALMISVETTPPLNEPPVADPGGPYGGTVGAPIAFDGSGSFDPEGKPLSYFWDFGDRSAGETGPRPSHAYAAEGSYTVTLAVTDDSGATGTMTTVADVNATPQNQPPIPSAGGPYAGIVGTTITFDGSGSRDPDGTIGAYEWDFGDGSTGRGASVMHTYAAPATYQVTLTVTDNLGATASDVADAVLRDASTSSLLVVLRAPGRVRMRENGREVKIGVAVDLSSLPPDTTGCGTATLFKNDQLVGTESFCIERRDHDDDDDDDEDEDDRNKSRREMKVKTSSGVVAMHRPTRETWAKAGFKVQLTAGDAPSVVWVAEVELLGQTGESPEVTTQVRSR